MLTTSLLLNVVLVTQIAPLVPYYRVYWDARSWVSQNVLGRPRPGTNVIFQSDEFMLRPAPRPTPRFRLGDVLQTDDPHQLQAELRAAVVEAFALERVPRGELDFVTHSSEQLPGYIRHKVSYQTQSGVRIPAYLLEPSEVPPPWVAVLVIHGCGYGKAGPAGLIDDIHNSLGIYLARAGFLVLVPDRRGFGELQPVPHYVPPSCGSGMPDGRLVLEWDANQAFHTSLRALQTLDLLVAVEYLHTRQDVSGIVVVGHSGGSILAQYVTGLSDTVDAVVLSGSLNYGELLGEPDTPSVARGFDQLPQEPLDLIRIGLISRAPVSIPTEAFLLLLPPRPVLVLYGDSDATTWRRPGFRGTEMIRRVYDLFDLGTLVTVQVETGGHELFPEPILEFLWNVFVPGE